MSKQTDKDVLQDAFKKGYGVTGETTEDDKVAGSLSVGKPSGDNIFFRREKAKGNVTYYIEKDIINFFANLAETTGTSSSIIVNDFLIQSIINSDDLKELVEHNEEAKELVRDFISKYR